MKKFNIGGKSFTVPDTDSSMTAVINRLTDLNESGQLHGLFVVFSGGDSIGACVLGDAAHQVFCSVMAAELSEAAVQRIVDCTIGSKGEDDE